MMFIWVRYIVVEDNIILWLWVLYNIVLVFWVFGVIIVSFEMSIVIVEWIVEEYFFYMLNVLMGDGDFFWF